MQKYKIFSFSFCRLANFVGEKSTNMTKKESGSSLDAYVKSLFDATLQWSDVEWLKSITRLPIILKGILTAQDARLGVQAGASGILVSNHGARQIDDTPASVSIKNDLCFSKIYCKLVLECRTIVFFLNYQTNKYYVRNLFQVTSNEDIQPDHITSVKRITNVNSKSCLK